MDDKRKRSADAAVGWGAGRFDRCFEKAVLEHTLAACKGELKAALGLPRKTFYDKLKRHGLSRGDFGG